MGPFKSYIVVTNCPEKMVPTQKNRKHVICHPKSCNVLLKAIRSWIEHFMHLVLILYK